MIDTPFDETNDAQEIQDLMKKRGIESFCTDLKQEFYTHTATQKRLPAKVQKIVYKTPVLFLPKSKWEIDDSRGFTSCLINGNYEDLVPLTDERKQSLYTATLSIHTNNLGIIERVEYESVMRPTSLTATKTAVRCIKYTMQYHQTTTIQHLRSIFMGLFAPYGASRMTCDSIVMYVWQATRDGHVDNPYEAMGCEGYIKYECLQPQMTEHFSAVFDFTKMYKQLIPRYE